MAPKIELEEPEEAQIKRSPGRRQSDGVKRGTAWALAVGVLLQGGFLTMSWRLLAVGERQLERERAAMSQQLDRERSILLMQHAELVASVKELASAVRERCR